MSKINLSFISITRKRKFILASVLLFIFLFVLLYLYVYELIDVIAKEDIFDNLVSIDGSPLKNVCPLSHVEPLNFLPGHSISYWPHNSAYIRVDKLNISRGGEWQPGHCAARFLVAIIIPFRRRESNLKAFMHYIHPFVQKQNIHYKFYVIEQSKNKKFNRGKLFNVGFIEALKDNSFPCFIFHDVDLLPENENNIYACTKAPRHMSAAIDKYDYRPPYYRNFGGVLSILVEHYRHVNGFSNEFYGWGGEDDDFYNRLRTARIRPARFDYDVSRYYSLSHEPTIPNENRFNILNGAWKTNDLDGFTSTSYSIIRRSDEPLFTRIVVEV